MGFFLFFVCHDYCLPMTNRLSNTLSHHTNKRMLCVSLSVLFLKRRAAAERVSLWVGFFGQTAACSEARGKRGVFGGPVRQAFEASPLTARAHTEPSNRAWCNCEEGDAWSPPYRRCTQDSNLHRSRSTLHCRSRWSKRKWCLLIKKLRLFINTLVLPYLVDKSISLRTSSRSSTVGRPADFKRLLQTCWLSVYVCNTLVHLHTHKHTNQTHFGSESFSPFLFLHSM